MSILASATDHVLHPVYLVQVTVAIEHLTCRLCGACSIALRCSLTRRPWIQPGERSRPFVHLISLEAGLALYQRMQQKKLQKAYRFNTCILKTTWCTRELDTRLTSLVLEILECVKECRNWNNDPFQINCKPFLWQKWKKSANVKCYITVTWTNHSLVSFVPQCKYSRLRRSFFHWHSCLKDLFWYEVLTRRLSKKFTNKVDCMIHTNTWRCKTIRKIFKHFTSVVNLWHMALSILRIFLHCKPHKRICKILHPGANTSEWVRRVK